MIERGRSALSRVDGGDRGVAGREHRIDDDHVAVAHVLGDLVVVLDRLERLGIAVQADVADARRRQDVEHAVEDAGAGAEDRDEHDLLAVEHGAIVGAIGVSIWIFVVGKSRQTSYARSMVISRSSARNLLVLDSLSRISVSLC